jgi:hypothetical protein
MRRALYGWGVYVANLAYITMNHCFIFIWPLYHGLFSFHLLVNNEYLFAKYIIEFAFLLILRIKNRTP